MGRLTKKKSGNAPDVKSQPKISGFFSAPTASGSSKNNPTNLPENSKEEEAKENKSTNSNENVSRKRCYEVIMGLDGDRCTFLIDEKWFSKKPKVDPNEKIGEQSNAECEISELGELDGFDDEFENIDVSQEERKLPLAASYNRHKILEIDDTVTGQLILILEDQFDKTLQRKAIIKGSWLQTVFNIGDIVHLEGNFTEDIITISDQTGSVVVNPDFLVSGTSVVSALFCLRKAVLSEMYKGGGGGGSKVMLLGTIVHELFQQVLGTREFSKEKITEIMNKIIHSTKFMQDMAYLGLTEEEMRKEAAPFIDHIQYFIKKFVHGEQEAAPPPVATPDRVKPGTGRPQWTGKIDDVADIEENFWSPRLGIKGKIDLTVKVDGTEKLLPLELKTGRPTISAEHAGQVKLYMMMSRDRREAPGSGLLLYLRSSNIVEIPSSRHEERGLIQLRNQLVAYLNQSVSYKDGEVSDFILPEPIDFEKACKKCDFRDICCTYQKITNVAPSSKLHPIEFLSISATSHLSQEHLDWFKHWSDMLRLEGSESRINQKALWTLTAEDRQKTGNCVANLSSVGAAHNFIHTLSRDGRSLPQIFQAGEVVVVSTDDELAVSQGPVIQSDKKCLVVQLDRKLSAHKLYHVDRHVYQSAMGSQFIAIGKMLADSPEAENLRSIIIDGCDATFKPGLTKDVAILARGSIKHLNKVQQKAIFRCLMANKFCLLRGMPGSGKTTTIVGLIRLLAAQGCSVLLVAYTNSAVDTVLCKLKKYEKKFLRLGRVSRVRKELKAHTADHVAASAKSCDELAKLYSEYKIIGTTCLATDHAALVNRKFDWCIVDEATQALIPSIIHPLLHCNKFVLVGDPAQLPPVVQSPSARQMGLSQTLFDLLDKPNATVQLNLQYRMNKVISELANHLTYKGSLECANDEVAERTLKIDPKTLDIVYEAWLKVVLDPSLEKSVIFLDTRGLAKEESGNSGIWNENEKKLIMLIIRQGIASGLKQTDISVIAPYTAQCKLIKNSLTRRNYREVEVGTVDQFQGRDCELVIFSCTRSFTNSSDDKESSTKSGHILKDERRLNVAITRARSKLILVGDLKTLIREYKPFRKMHEFLQQGRIITC